MEPVSGPEAAAAASVLEMARRMGPLPYSERGPNPAPRLPPTAVLAGWLVDAVDDWWAELGRPDPFTLVEIGAGDGARAEAFLAGGPACLTALRYVLVDDDPLLRDRQRARLPIESPILVLGPVGPDDEDEDDLGDEPARAVVGIGPLLTSLREPPVVDGAAVVVALGWAGRLPSDRLEWRRGGWWEVRLSAAGDKAQVEVEGWLSELPVPLDPARTDLAERWAGPSPRPDGARYAVLGPAVDWLAQTLRVAGSGRLAVLDRWTVVTRPLPPGLPPPLALDQLAAVRRPLDPVPVELFPEVSMVSWRLG